MKVRCVSATDDRLTNGREYVVVAILVDPSRGLGNVFVIDDLGGRTWFPTRQFETTSGRIPPSWVARIDSEDGAVTLSPRRLLEDDFWDRMNSGSGPARRAASEILREEIALLEEFDSRSEPR